MRNKKFLIVMILGILGLLGGSLALCFETLSFLTPFITVVLGLSFCAATFSFVLWLCN